MYIFLQISLDLAPLTLYAYFQFNPITPVKLCLQDLVEHSTSSFQKKNKEKSYSCFKKSKKIFFYEEKIATPVLWAIYNLKPSLTFQGSLENFGLSCLHFSPITIVNGGGIHYKHASSQHLIWTILWALVKPMPKKSNHLAL